MIKRVRIVAFFRIGGYAKFTTVQRIVIFCSRILNRGPWVLSNTLFLFWNNRELQRNKL